MKTLIVLSKITFALCITIQLSANMRHIQANLSPNLPQFCGPRIEAVVEHSTVDKVGCGKLMFCLFRVESDVSAKEAKSLKASEGKLS